MICNSLRASARAGCCRRVSSYLDSSSAGRLQKLRFASTTTPQECRRTHDRSTGGSSNLAANTRQLPISLSKDQGIGNGTHRTGVSSSTDEKDAPPPPPPPPSTTTTNSKPQQQTLADRWRVTRSKVSAEYLRRFLKKYGRVAVTFHISVFLATLGTCYSVVDYGGLDIPALVKDFPLLADNLPPASAGNLAIAYGMTSAVGPPRAVLTITLTPRIARFFSGREASRLRDQGKTPPS